MPDLHVTRKRLVSEGRVVAAEIQLSGTPVSEWRGHPPTGATFVWDTCSFYDLDQDREHLLRERMYYDAGALDRQLAGPGAAPRQPSQRPPAAPAWTAARRPRRG